jgi:hypothetical protein
MEIGDNHLPVSNSLVYTNLPLGTVIRTHVVDTNPPKTKIFIIVGYYGNDAITVYFNSEINHYSNYSQELQNLHIPFGFSGKSYLTKDCYCDCSFLSIKDKDLLHQATQVNPSICKGQLSTEDLDKVMIMLKGSPTIKGTLKKRYGFYTYQPTTII